MKNKHLFIPLFVFLGACLVSLVYSVIDYKGLNRALAYSSKTLQFNYDGASDGKDPNGNNFNAVAFLTDDVLEAALTKSQITEEVSKVRSYIAMENVVPENIVDEVNSYQKLVGDDSNTRNITTNDYHPVRYRFVVYQDINKKLSKKLSRKGLNDLVGNIVDEYCARFYETYKKSFASEAYNNLLDISGYDYVYQTQIYVTRFNILMDYANKVYQEHDDFVVDGQSFKDVYLRAQQLINSDADRVNRLIVFNALSNDAEKLKDYYTYLKDVLTKDKAKYTDDQTAIEAQIASYVHDNESATVMVANGDTVMTVDSNTAETYNALVAKQIEINNTITRLTTEITECQNALDKLDAASGDAAIKTTVEGLLADLGQDYADLETLFKAMMEAYNKQYVTEAGVITVDKVNYTSDSLFSTSFIVRCIKNAAPIVLATLLGITIYFLVREIRKQKKAA